MTEKNILKAINEISEICKKYDIILIGTCNDEGIYGEISIEKRGNTFHEGKDFELQIESYESFFVRKI